MTFSSLLLKIKFQTYGMNSCKRIGRPEGVVDGHSGCFLLVERHTYGNTGTGACENGTPVAEVVAEHTILVCIGGTQTEIVLKVVFKAEDELVAGEGVGIEVAGESNGMQISYMEIVGSTDAEGCGKFEVSRALLNSEQVVVVSVSRDHTAKRETVA